MEVSITPVREITGDLNFLWRFECVWRSDGSVVIHEIRSIGTPIAHAPQHVKSSALDDTDIQHGLLLEKLKALADELNHGHVVG